MIPRWALLDWRYCATAYYLHVWCKTDEPNTLVMRWNPYAPIIRREYPEERGVPHDLIEWLFPKRWRGLKQNPPFDTQFHTFTLLLWPEQRELWILFVSTALIPRSPSQNGPFHVFFPRYPVRETLFLDPFASLPCSV